jgi:tetrahydromethanopterin S-methyltransferase subunit D
MELLATILQLLAIGVFFSAAVVAAYSILVGWTQGDR